MAGRLDIAYQLILSLATGEVTGAEALLRYEDPERGLLAAEQFIDVAEDSGLVILLGTWVLEEACREAAGWRERGWGLPVTVNLGRPPDCTGHTRFDRAPSPRERAGLDPILHRRRDGTGSEGWPSCQPATRPGLEGAVASSARRRTPLR